MNKANVVVVLLEQYDHDSQFGDGCVIEVNWILIQEENEVKYCVGDKYNGTSIVAAFVHPESESAWLILDGFEVWFDSYISSGI